MKDVRTQKYVAPRRRFPVRAYAILSAVQKRSLGCARGNDTGKGYHHQFESRDGRLVTRRHQTPVSSFRAKREIFVIRGQGLTLSLYVPRTSPLFSSVFHTARALSAPTGHLPLEGKADDTRETCHRSSTGIARFILRRRHPAPVSLFRAKREIFLAD